MQDQAGPFAGCPPRSRSVAQMDGCSRQNPAYRSATGRGSGKPGPLLPLRAAPRKRQVTGEIHGRLPRAHALRRPPTTVLAGDTTQLEAALHSGAQLVSTDLPEVGMSARYDR